MIPVAYGALVTGKDDTTVAIALARGDNTQVLALVWYDFIASLALVWDDTIALLSLAKDDTTGALADMILAGEEQAVEECDIIEGVEATFIWGKKLGTQGWHF